MIFMLEWVGVLENRSPVLTVKDYEALAFAHSAT